jgi:hypothetical protein
MATVARATCKSNVRSLRQLRVLLGQSLVAGVTFKGRLHRRNLISRDIPGLILTILHKSPPPG